LAAALTGRRFFLRRHAPDEPFLSDRRLPTNVAAMSEQPSRDPRLAAAVDAVVAALQEKSDRALAIRLARTALGEGLVHPLFLNLRAFWLEERGRLQEAATDLEHAHRLAPDDVPVLNALGLILTKLDRAPEAAKVFRTAIAHQPDFVPAYFNLARACDMSGELDEARHCYERAAELSADRPSAAEPLAGLAWLASRRGDWDEARAYADRVLALAPAQTTALLAKIRADVQTGNLDAAETQLQQFFAMPSLSVDDHYHAMGALGDLRHRQGRYAEAFTAYADSNARWRKAAPARFREGETVLQSVRWMRRYYEAVPAVRASATALSHPAGEAARHVFLLGFIRSGTTLLEQVLACHPDVVTMEEKEALTDAGHFLADAGALDRLRTLSADQRDAYARAYWQRVKEMGFEPANKVFVDKQPFHTTRLPLIATLFPSAKILFAVRDPRDVILSCFRQRFRVTAYTYELLTLEDAARFYDAYMALAARLREVLPLDLHEIRHEDLVDDFEGEVGKVCEFLGIAWTDAMRDFAERRKVRAIATPSAAQIAKGLNREGIGQWRRYREQLAPILPILRPWAERFGYPAD
jgi:tetratricopeptide (TPR) repeat protein